MDSSQAKLSVVLYRTKNVGDSVQTIALSRLLPQSAGVYRHRMKEAPADRLFVVNGMLDKDTPPKSGGPVCLFAGISGPHFREKAYLRWLSGSPFPIGARDQATVDALNRAGQPVVLTGCATLTLPRYDGPRKGIYSVDCVGPGEQITHSIARSTSVEVQWETALAALARFRTAEAVYTSRLHVALPCLAFGTPVWIANPQHNAWHPSRFSLIEEMGLEYEKLQTADVTPFARRYVDFLECQLGMNLEGDDPKLPTPPAKSALPWWQHLPIKAI